MNLQSPSRWLHSLFSEKVLTFLSLVERNSEEKSQFLFLSRFISDASAACQAALAFIHDTRKQAGFGSGCLPSHH